MQALKYHHVTSVDDAVAMLSSADEGKLLGGGQTLLPTIKQRLAAPSDLISLRGAGLSGISLEGRDVVIGAMTTHAEVASDKTVAGAIPALAVLASGIGDPHVRHRGTIGGSVANNDPAADYPAAVLALGAAIVTNAREIPATDFFTGLFSTDLDDGEIITSIRFPQPERAGYAKFKNPASGYAMVGVFVAKTSDGVCVAVTGAGEDGVFRHAGLEAALASDYSADAILDVDISSEGLLSDIHGNSAYRANLIRVMAKRAIAAS